MSKEVAKKYIFGLNQQDNALHLYLVHVYLDDDGEKKLVYTSERYVTDKEAFNDAKAWVKKNPPGEK